jgi:hypothetical protein
MVNSHKVCEGSSYNVASQNQPYTNADILSGFDANDNTIGYVTAGCELSANWPANYGDIYFGADNCLYDSSGKQIFSECCKGPTTKKALNPYAPAPQCLSNIHEYPSFSLYNISLKLNDGSTTDVPGLLNSMAQALCSGKCQAPSNVPANAGSTNNEYGICQINVAISSNQSAHVVADSSLPMDVCTGAVALDVSTCVIPGSGNNWDYGILKPQGGLVGAAVGPLNDKNFMHGYIDPNNALQKA